LSSCSSSEFKGRIDDPPPVRSDYGPQLAKEFTWWYADFQDLLFGLDYYEYLEKRWGEGPYE
jgi:hypothetical protein